MFLLFIVMCALDMLLTKATYLKLHDNWKTVQDISIIH